MSAAKHTPGQAYPSAWGLELVRNPSGRAFWFVSRFVARNRLEYVNDIAGKPQCFRLERDARAAIANATSQQTNPTR